METQFYNDNRNFFKKLLFHNDHVIRTRAVCVLAEIGGEDAVRPISIVLERDEDELVRHEAAFSLGQLGLTTGISSLSKALENDKSIFVRHEAAIALGIIGSEEGRKILNNSLNGVTKVKKSAIVALANLDYISRTRKINKFTRMTEG